MPFVVAVVRASSFITVMVACVVGELPSGKGHNLVQEMVEVMEDHLDSFTEVVASSSFAKLFLNWIELETAKQRDHPFCQMDYNSS